MLVNDILERTLNLKKMHDDALVDRQRFRAIMNGGTD